MSLTPQLSNTQALNCISELFQLLVYLHARGGQSFKMRVSIPQNIENGFRGSHWVWCASDWFKAQSKQFFTSQPGTVLKAPNAFWTFYGWTQLNYKHLATNRYLSHQGIEKYRAAMFIFILFRDADILWPKQNLRSFWTLVSELRFAPLFNKRVNSTFDNHWFLPKSQLA